MRMESCLLRVVARHFASIWFTFLLPFVFLSFFPAFPRPSLPCLRRIPPPQTHSRSSSSSRVDAKLVVQVVQVVPSILLRAERTRRKRSERARAHNETDRDRDRESALRRKKYATKEKTKAHCSKTDRRRDLYVNAKALLETTTTIDAAAHLVFFKRVVTPVSALLFVRGEQPDDFFRRWWWWWWWWWGFRHIFFSSSSSASFFCDDFKDAKNKKRRHF